MSRERKQGSADGVREARSRRHGDDDRAAAKVHEVAVIGTGFAGLGMSIKLKRQGITDFVVLERAASVGGTWRDNTYPGIQCDVPSHLYSLSFAPNPDWSRAFSPGQEIWEYLKRTADEQGITPHIRFDSEVTEARWSEEERIWVAADGVRRGPLPSSRRRPRRARRAAAPRRARDRGLPGRGHALGPLEPRLRPARQAGRRDRDRRLVDPDRAADPAARRRARPLPADARLDRAAARPRDQRPPPPALPPLPDPPEADPRSGSSGAAR